MLAKERLWKILASSWRTENDVLVKVHFETYAYAEDAGTAWLEFQKQYPGAMWYEISVTEVKKNERSKGIPGADQVV